MSDNKLSKKRDEFGLTQKQKLVCEAIFKAKMKGRLYPTSITDLAKAAGVSDRYLRDTLAKPVVKQYILYLIEQDGLILETAFWKGLGFGVSIGDVKALELYAKITGKLVQKQERKVTVEVVGPQGQPSLPSHQIAEIIDVEAIEMEDDDDST